MKLKQRGRQRARRKRGRAEKRNLVLVLVTEPAVTAEKREEQCLRLTQISRKISPIVDRKCGYGIEQHGKE